MKLGILGFALGAAWLQWRPTLPTSIQWVMALVLVLVLVWLLYRLNRKAVVDKLAGGAVGVERRSRIVTLCAVLFSRLVMGFLVGVLWAAGFAHWRLADRLDPQWEGRDLTLTGVIASLPQPFDRGVRFDFDIEAVQPSDAIVPKRISLVWYNGLSPDEFQWVMPVRAGERWRFAARLRLPHGSANPHGFDYEAWLLERGIRATGFVRARGGGERLDEFVASPGSWIERLREAIRIRFWEALDNTPYAGILIALAIGDQRAIEPDDWQVFARTGVSHLMSISGLHVTMISGLIAWLMFNVWCRVPALALRMPAQKAAAAAAVVAALAYCLLAGYAVPAQRTLYMVSAVALALWLDRLSAASNVLALALLVVLLLDPWAVLSPGFWLSFGAVAVIFYVSVRRSEKRHWLAQWGAAQWAVTLGLAPMTLVLFQQVSLVSPIANALAIPLISLVITPLALLGAVLPFELPLRIAHGLLEWLVPLLEAMSSLNGAVWTQHAPAWWTLPFALFGVLWLLAPRGTPSRFLGWVMLWPMFAVAPERPGAGDLWLRFLDVGQGMAVEVRTHHFNLLYDTGPAWGPQSDSGERVLLPYLRAEGIRQLDNLTVSHDDGDHSGGAASILRGTAVAWIASSLKTGHPLHDPVAKTNVYRSNCRAGQRWTWDGVQFEYLHPVSRAENPFRTTNDDSCVLRIVAPGGTALLAGDIERIAERELLVTQPDKLRADVLLAPHHGSGTSSTPEFIAAVAPRHVVFQVGYRNRFGHPRGDVVERYRQAGARLWRSDREGAVRMVVGVSGVTASAERVERQRYWHRR